MGKRKSVWDDDSSRYGTYEGEPGSPEQWAAGFSATWSSSVAVSSILGQHASGILGVVPGASEQEIKTAYRNLARIHHPDKGGDVNKFQEIKAARDLLLGKVPSDFSPTPTGVKRKHKKHEAAYDDEPAIIPQLLTPIDESEVERYLSDPAWGAQEKKDGNHITLQCKDGRFIVRNKKGQPSDTSEFKSSLLSLKRNVLIDGEHIKNKFYVWDLLEIDTVNLRNVPYQKRFEILNTIPFDNLIRIVPLAVTEQEKRALFEDLKRRGKEGIVFKRLAAHFTPGKGLDQVKYKFYESASVIVVQGRNGKASIGMELFNDNGQREFVGYCTCSLYPLPSVDSIAEIKYLYAYKNGCLYQPAFKELRDDVDLQECTTSQLKYKSEEE